VRLECRIPSVGRYKQTGKQTPLSLGTELLTTAKAREQSSTYGVRLEWRRLESTKLSFQLFCYFALLAPSGKCHVLFSFTGCTAHTLAHPEHKPLLTAREIIPAAALSLLFTW